MANDTEPSNADLLADVRDVKRERTKLVREVIMPQVVTWLGTGQEAQIAAAVIQNILHMFVWEPAPDVAALLENVRISTERFRHRRRTLLTALRAVPGILNAFSDGSVDDLVPLFTDFFNLEPGLEGVSSDPAALSGRLARISARRADRKITAERALAEFIYEEQDALGIVVDLEKDPETEVERIRKLLVKDMRSK